MIDNISILQGDSYLWSGILLLVLTTSNTTSPAGLVLGLILMVRPSFLSLWWSDLTTSYSPLVLTGLVIPGLVLVVYWVHGLLHLVVDITRWPPLYQYKIQTNKHLDTSRLSQHSEILLFITRKFIRPIPILIDIIKTNNFKYLFFPRRS